MAKIRRFVRREYLRCIQIPYEKNRPGRCENFRDDRTPYGKDLWDQMPTADIINLHWINDFVDYRGFLSVAASTPIVWTIHDMNPFTGGCHQDWGCGRYEEMCGACPQLGSTRERDLSRRVHHRKEIALRRLSREQVRIVAGNSWLAEAARKSTLFSRFDVTTIHLGIDTGIFRPRDRNALRASLEIPETAFVVLFATNEIHNISNGFHLLLKALKHVRGTRPVYLLSIGDRELRVHTPFKHIHLGRLTCDEMRSVFYNAGDCLVIPSVQEISGLTALEAMSCETPVAGFATGAITDMIKPGKTGLLIEPGNTAELAESIHWLMEHPREGRAMGEEARMLVKQEFTIDKQAREYTNLYNDLEQKIAISTW